jgi:DNA-binding transcriptional LysR family regulator
VTDSVPLQAHWAAAGSYLSVFTTSGQRHADHAVLRQLPVKLPPPSPIGIMTLKKRTMSPVVERFIDFARKVAKSLEN